MHPKKNKKSHPLRGRCRQQVRPARKSTANCRHRRAQPTAGKKKKERAYCWHPPEWGSPNGGKLWQGQSALSLGDPSQGGESSAPWRSRASPPRPSCGVLSRSFRTPSAWRRAKREARRTWSWWSERRRQLLNSEVGDAILGMSAQEGRTSKKCATGYFSSGRRFTPLAGISQTQGTLALPELTPIRGAPLRGCHQ